MKSLLRLQNLDLKIQACRERELEIPKQKNRYKVQRQRLDQELEESEQTFTKLQLAQRECEGEIGQLQEKIAKYDTQLNSVKKNDEYQAILHEIENLKKQVSQKEERLISLMMELDEAKAKLEADRERIQAERKRIDEYCQSIDAELAEAVAERSELEAQRTPLVEDVAPELLRKYERIRVRYKKGPSVVRLRDEVCTGCNMALPPQIVNEVLGGKIRACPFCGRLVYEESTVASQ